MTDLIDRQALLKDIEQYHLSDGKFQHWVEVQPSVESVIHCKDCFFGYLRKGIINRYEDTWIECINPNGLNRDVSIDGYCSAGVRKEQENGRERKGNDERRD